MTHIMRNNMCLFAFASLIVLGASWPTQASDSTRTEIVVAEGVGRDSKAANAEACRNAVRQVVGAYVDSEQVVQNDSVISDRILSLSAGFIEKIEPIPGSEGTVDGLVRIRIRAHVRVDRLVESLGKSNIKTRASTTAVDGASLAAQLLTKSDRVQAQGEIIDRLFESYPARAFSAAQTGKESVERAPDGTVWVNVPITISTAPDWKERFASPFVTALSADGRKRGVLTIPTEPAKYGDRAPTFLDLWQFVGFGNLVDQATYQQVLASADSKGSSSTASLDGVRSFRIPEPPKALSRDGFFTLCLTGHSGGYRGTTWSWFELSEEEWRRWFAPRSSYIACTVLALDASGDELGRDAFRLKVDWTLGDRYFSSRRQLLSPLIGVDWVGNLYFASELKLTRRVSFDEADVEKVAAIRVSVEPLRRDE